MHLQTFTHTLVATGAGKQRRFVTAAGAQAAAANKPLGVALVDFAAGEAFAAHVVGVCAVESGGAVALDDPVGPDAGGRAITVAAGAATQGGRALNAVAAAGQILFILLK